MGESVIVFFVTNDNGDLPVRRLARSGDRREQRTEKSLFIGMELWSIHFGGQRPCTVIISGENGGMVKSQ